MTTRKKFRLAYAGLFVFLVAVWALVAVDIRLPHPSLQQTYAIEESAWGHVQAHDGAYVFTLGPAADTRRRYELGLGRVTFTAAAMIVADDAKGTNAVQLDGEPMGECGFHFQGHGINAIVAIKKCVPSWASVTGSPKTHAAEWIRVENLRSKPRVVLLRYQ